MTDLRDARIALQQRVAALEHEVGLLRAEASEKTEELAQRRRDLEGKAPERPTTGTTFAGFALALVATAAGIAYVGTRRTSEPPASECPPVATTHRTDLEPLDVELDAVLVSTSSADDGRACRISIFGRRRGGQHEVEEVALVCDGTRTLYRTNKDPRAPWHKLTVARDTIEGARVLYTEEWSRVDGTSQSATIDTDRGEASFRITKSGEEDRTWTARILPAGGAK